MIITEFRGRIGNGLFQMAIGLYLSKKLNVQLAVRPFKNSRLDYYYHEIFPFEFFKNFKQLDLNYDVSNYKTIHNNKKYTSYKDFPLKDNIIISDWFLGKNYVHYDSIKDVFKPSKELTEEICDLYNPTRNSLMINIRRGDFLDQKNIDLGWYSAPKKYWESTYKFLNKKYDKVFVTSDDLEWCKENIDFCDNLVLIDKETENSKIFFDLFFGSFVGDHIISASTFSWWQAYLNQYKNKQVIMPYPWNTILADKRNKQYYLKNSIKFDIYKYININ